MLTLFGNYNTYYTQEIAKLLTFEVTCIMAAIPLILLNISLGLQFGAGSLTCKRHESHFYADRKDS